MESKALSEQDSMIALAFCNFSYAYIEALAAHVHVPSSMWLTWPRNQNVQVSQLVSLLQHGVDGGLPQRYYMLRPALKISSVWRCLGDLSTAKTYYLRRLLCMHRSSHTVWRSDMSLNVHVYGLFVLCIQSPQICACGKRYMISTMEWSVQKAVSQQSIMMR